MKQEFNLIDEKWICVRTTDCRVIQVSLKDAIINSHNYIELAGETKTQDFAVLRLLLAIIYTVFSRFDLDGEPIDFRAIAEEPDILLENWSNMWKNRQIATTPVERYFEKWYDRFWLFDEEYPFYQSKAVKGKSDPTGTAKIIGTLFESANKKRLFSDRQKEGRQLSYAEATRWLLHINCFDDISAKNPTPKKTWGSRLGLIALKGRNLFETLMLNYRAGFDVDNDVYEESPYWEKDSRVVEFNHNISVPDNQAELLSLISRRIWLCCENGSVTGYYLSGGDYFDENEVFSEQMTLWECKQKKKGMPYSFEPKLYDPAKKVWREFGSIAPLKENTEGKHRCAGIVEWIRELYELKFIDISYPVLLETASVIYNRKQSSSLPVIDMISDSITFHAQLLEEVGLEWNSRILEEIDNCDKAAYYVGQLYKRLQYANGRRDKDSKTEQSGELDAKTLFYERIDRPFRLWLEELNPETVEDVSGYLAKLEKELAGIAIRTGNEFVKQIGSQAIFSCRRTKSENNNGDNENSSAAKALDMFIAMIYKTFSRAGEKNEDN